MNKSTFRLLTPEQQFWYASIMIDIILADGVVHVSEQAYLNQVFEMFQEHPEKLEKLKKKGQKSSSEKILPIAGISAKHARRILQDVVNVCIADAEFHNNEKQLIDEIGKQLQLDEDAIEKAITRGQKQLGHIFAFAS